MRSSGTQVWSESDRGVGKVNQIVYEFEQKSKFQKLPPCLECCQIQCLKPLTVVGTHVSIIDIDVSILDSYVSISSIDVDVGCCNIYALAIDKCNFTVANVYVSDIDDRYMNISDRNIDIDYRNIDIDDRNVDNDDRYMNETSTSVIETWDIDDRNVDINDR